MKLDPTQMQFVKAQGSHIRLLAPAGCGKTMSLLYRCQEVFRRDGGRFLVVTFTRAAMHALEERLHSPEFADLRGHIRITTLNSYGYERMRRELGSPRLLKTNDERFFAMRNQLRPIWSRFEHVKAAASGRGRQPRRLFGVMDALKSLGFDHTTDVNYARFKVKLDAIQATWLGQWMEEQFDELTQLKVLDSKSRGGEESSADSPRQFYDRFFRFWREATAHLHEELTFTFDDQKYWCWLDMRSPDAAGNLKPQISGGARYDHILVDEFQDINPLDLALIKTLVDRNGATLTIVGDDDQAIFEWRGATPEYILEPEPRFNAAFEDHILEINYRSPANIVQHAERLIANNVRRVKKPMKAVNSQNAEIRVVETHSISERLKLVGNIAKEMNPGERVAVVGRVRSQLIPYEVFYASDGGEVRIAIDLDALASKAFDNLTDLLDIWTGGTELTRPTLVIDSLMDVCSLIRRAPFSRKNAESVRGYLRRVNARTTLDAARSLAEYDGPKLSGKAHTHLAAVAERFLDAKEVWQAMTVIADDFDGLRFDFEKSEDDVWYTDPPLKQLGDMAQEERLSAEDLVERLAVARERVRHSQFGDEDEAPRGDHTLELMTAYRAKGKEFDTVVILDAVQGLWPHKRAKENAALEAERRLFYVAFTRAKRRVLMLTTEGAPPSPFVFALGLPPSSMSATAVQGTLS